MLFIEIIPYVMLLLLLGINLKINTRQSNNFVFFVMFLFSAMRYEVGYDYVSYMETIVSGSKHAIDRFEIAQKWLAIASRYTFPQLFFIANSFIAVYFVKWGVERISKNVSLSVFTFYTFPLLFVHSLNIVRFWSGLAILFYASTLVPEKQYLKAILFFSLSLAFHNGAVIGLLFIPIFLFPIPFWVNVIILIFGFLGGELVLSKIIGMALPSSVYTEQLLLYVEREGADGMAKIPYIFLFFDLLAFFKLKSFESDSNLYKQFSIFNIGVSLMFLFSFQTTLSIRIASPFILYLIVIVPYLIEYRYEKHKQYGWNLKLVVYFILCCSLLIYNITIYNETLGRSQYLPYKLFFLQ